MRFVIAGNGKMAIDVVSAVEAAGGQVALCVGDPALETPQSRLAKLCAARGVGYHQTLSLNDAATVAKLQAAAPDYIISANNFLIFKAPSLAVPRLGVVNFHNGPLPRYGGLNACSWALLNGERQHGVTWHLVEPGIDTGPVLAQRLFAIEPGETAISLTSRCITRGVELLTELLPHLLKGTQKGSAQDHSQRLYYGRADVPFAGWLPWSADLKTLERLSQAISFHPLPNTFCRPRVAAVSSAPVWGEGFSIDRITDPTAAAHAAKPGTVLAVSEDAIQIVAAGCVLTLHDGTDASGAPLSADVLDRNHGIKAGVHLLPPAA